MWQSKRLALEGDRFGWRRMKRHDGAVGTAKKAVPVGMGREKALRRDVGADRVVQVESADYGEDTKTMLSCETQYRRRPASTAAKTTYRQGRAGGLGILRICLGTLFRHAVCGLPVQLPSRSWRKRSRALSPVDDSGMGFEVACQILGCLLQGRQYRGNGFRRSE